MLFIGAKDKYRSLVPQRLDTYMLSISIPVFAFSSGLGQERV